MSVLVAARRASGVCVALASAVGLLVSCPSAQSTVSERAAWLAPAIVSKPGAYGPRVAVDARGNVTVVWATDEGTDQGAINAVTRPSGGHFGKPEQVSARGVSAVPDLAVDGAGNATVVWASGDPPSVVVQAATQRAGSPFGAPRQIGGPDTYIDSPRIAANARGEAVAGWVASDDPLSTAFSPRSHVLRVAFRPAGRRFGPPEDVVEFAAATDTPQFELAIDAKGDALVTWLSYRLLHSVVAAAYRPAGGSFGAPQTLAEANGETVGGRSASLSQVDGALRDDGDAVVAWWNSGTIEAAYRPAATGAWQPRRTLGQAPQCCGGPTLAVDADGNAIAAWVVWDETRAVQAATLPSGAQDWQPPQTLSQPDAGSFLEPPAVAGGRRGDVIVGWAAFPSSPARVVAALRPRGGSFAPAGDVWRGSGWVDDPPVFALDAEGNATAVWRTAPGAEQRYFLARYLQAAGYDAAPPRLRSLRIPASARAGSVARFSVAPLDVWSGISSTRWSFGDGGHASGRRVSHVYRSMGRYPVRVVSSDRLGNATEATRTVTVRSFKTRRMSSAVR